MIQITYQPAFDSFHSIYRIFRILGRLKKIEIEKARIVDFYLLFPFRLSDVTFKRGDLRFRKLAQAYDNRRGYAIQPAPRGLFTSMRPVYDAAIQTMSGEGYLDESDFKTGLLTSTNKPIPEEIAARVSADNDREYDLLECLEALLEYNLLGPGGLKDRSGLMEHRNDAA